MGLLAAACLNCSPLHGCATAPIPTPAGPAVDQPPSAEQPAVEVATPVAPPDDSQPAPGLKLSEAAIAARAHAQQYILGASKTPFGSYASEPLKLPEVGTPAAGSLEELPGSAGSGTGTGTAPAATAEDTAEDGEPAETPAVDGMSLGVYVPLADNRPLEKFYRALRRLKRGEDEDGKVRVLVYGGSHTEADVYPSYLRSYLQHRFGDGGLGFVSMVRINRWYRQFALNVENSKHWTTEHAQRSKARDDGYYGLLGASVYTTKVQEYGRVTPRDRAPTYDGKTLYELFFLKQPRGGSFSVQIGEERIGTVDTRGKQYSFGSFAVSRDTGPEVIEVRPRWKSSKKSKKSKGKKSRSTGEIRLFGMVLENDSDGVVVDTLGISGTRASNHLKWDEPMWAEQVKRRDPDLYILAYGVNEASDTDVPISHYRETLKATLGRFKRAAPEASCLLVGPSDYHRKNAEGVFYPVPRTQKIRETQREVAAELGCGFWDTIAFMGGVGAMDVWANSEPQLGKADHIHMTKRGYLRLGMGLMDAIMDGYDNGDFADDAANDAPVEAASDAPSDAPAEAEANETKAAAASPDDAG